MSGGPVPYNKKYTAASKGIWDLIRRLLVIVPNRSSGNPIVPWYRIPSPGSRPEAATYTDPATLPASDIAENPYWKRDHRRNYPRIAYYDQPTVAGLLTLGSAANPRIADGDAGTKALSVVQQGQISLTQAIAESPKQVISGEVLNAEGLPPVPPSLREKKWKIIGVSQSGMYDYKYPVRMFT